MRRQTFGSTGRRGTVIAASAAALCLGGLLAACGSGQDDDGYVAVGAAAADGPQGPGDGSRTPSGKVTLIPLDGSGDRGGEGRGEEGRDGGPGGDGGEDGRGAGASSSSGAGGPGGRSVDPGGGERTRSPGPQGSGSPARPGTKPPTPGGDSGPGSPSSGRPGAPSAPGGPGAGGGTPGEPSPPAPPATPAAVKLSAPQRAAADKRWCEKVTVEFRNTGGTPARAGTVTFATHIIGALGVDWATITSAQPLPAPIAAGSARTRTYTVCVESWRVPLGMRVETQDVSAVWE